jgi:hypothetical protein
MLGFRLIFLVCCAIAGFHFRPFSVSKEMGAFGGFVFAMGVILFEVRLRRASLRRLIGAATGSILGILGAYLTSLILTHTIMPESTRSFFSLAIFLVMAYIGLVLGANKGDMLNLQAFGGVFGAQCQAFREAFGHERHYRRARGGHRGRPLSRRDHHYSAICFARTAARGRFGGPVEAPARAPRA